MGTINPTYQDRVEYTLQHKEFGSLIIQEPIGWRADGKEFARNKKYHGIFTKFSNNLKFIEDGADYIKIIYSLYGINTDLRLTRKEKHPKTDVWTKSYDGYLDLSTYSIENKQVSIKFNSSGLEQLIKSRESEKVEIERTDSIDGDLLSALSTQVIENKGRKIFLQSVFNGNEKESALTVVNSRGGNFYTAKTPFPMQIISNSDPERVQKPLALQLNGDEITAGHIFYSHNDRAKNLKLSFDISFIKRVVEYIKVRDNNQFIKLVLSIYKNGSNYDLKRDIEFFIDPEPRSQAGKKVSIVKVVDIELLEGESMMFYFYTGARTGFNNKNGYFNHEFKECKGVVTIEENSYFKLTTSKFILAKELGQRLLHIIAGKNAVLISNILDRTDLGADKDGEASFTAFSHGHWIRGFDRFPLPKPATPNSLEVLNKYKPFSTSWKDYLENLSVIWNVGLGIERAGYKERVVIEDLKYFYGNFVSIKLPNKVKKLKRSVAKEYYFSSLDVGYSKGWDNEEAMGLDEYNTKSNFLTNITKLKNKYSKISKYIAASYAKEFIRRKPKSLYPTEDHRNDKEIFVMDLKRGVNGFEERLWQQDFEKEPSGVFSPETATNLRFSPFNILLRHSWVIASGLTKYATKYIRFGSSEGNSNLKTKLNNGLEYSENRNIINSELQRPRFIPEWIEFEHEVNFEINQALEGTTKINSRDIPNVYGLIEFINDENELEKGYLFSLKPNGSGKWRLLKANR